MNKNNLNINGIIRSIQKRQIYWTEHCLYRLNKRNISVLDVKKAIYNGKIIEYYNNDYPYPSCLILGHDANKKVLHIVCGINNNIVYIITAYHPNIDKWEDDMKTRRKNNELF